MKNPPANAGVIGDAGSNLGLEYPLEYKVATHSSILAWKISQTEEPGRPQAMGRQRIGRDRVTEHAEVGVESSISPSASAPVHHFCSTLCG